MHGFRERKISFTVFQLCLSQFFFIQKKLKKKSRCDARSELSIVCSSNSYGSTWKIIWKNIAIFFRLGLVPLNILHNTNKSGA
jgi:hypothetical protein